MSEILSIMKKIRDKYNLMNLQKHPVANEELEIKVHYLNGLALMMNVDEEIHETEKKYLSILINTFQLEDSMLEQFTTFAKEPEEDATNEFLKIISNSEDTKINFMVDALIIADQDCNIHDNEKALLNYYFEMLSFSSEETRKVRDVAEIIKNKDKDEALSLFSADKEFYNKFAYLFEFFGIYVDTIIKNIFSFEWVNWEFQYGAVEKNNRVCRNPVTNRQFVIFLNSLNRRNLLIRGNKDSQLLMRSNLIIDTENSAISEDEKKFVSSDNNNLNYVTGSTVHGSTEFVKWLNCFLDESQQTGILGLFGTSLIIMKSDCIGKTKFEEIFHNKDNSSYYYFAPDNFGENASANDYTQSAKVNLRESSKNRTFRLMKLETNKKKNKSS